MVFIWLRVMWNPVIRLTNEGFGGKVAGALEEDALNYVRRKKISESVRR